MTKRFLLFIALGASACLSARAPTTPAERVQTASGVRVTLPHWFRADFSGPVEDAQETLQTPNGTMPCRRFTSKSETTFAEIRVVESPNGFDVPKEALLVDMVKKGREGKRLTQGTELHQGRFVGADMTLITAAHAPDNPSAYDIACRARFFVSETKIVIGTFCDDAAHPDQALRTSAESMVVLD
jgi:hypothetical protein